MRSLGLSIGWDAATSLLAIQHGVTAPGQLDATTLSATGKLLLQGTLSKTLDAVTLVSTFTLTSASFASWPSLLGAEMMVNGDCGSETGWTPGTGVTVNVVPGKMAATTASSNTYNDGVPDSALVANATYRCANEIDTATLGTAQVLIGSAAGMVRSAAGVFSEDLNCGDPGDGGWRIAFVGATMQLDNFSVKSVALMGVEADWTFGAGSAFFDAGDVVFEDADNVEAALSGSAATSFNSAVSNNTACSVTITDNGAPSGDIAVSMKGGAPVTFSFTGSGPITHTVTSGSGSGFSMTTVGTASLRIRRITIALA